MRNTKGYQIDILYAFTTSMYVYITYMRPCAQLLIGSNSIIFLLLQQNRCAYLWKMEFPLSDLRKFVCKRGFFEFRLACEVLD